ncbi:conserved uncharacterized protein, DUF1778 [Desulfosarcina variabilis str. Montpellier]|uniref:type II toxin-antitoxin system TacA family antitoxin n=1 Tax=Desulfosarcina variabilis TaxID=2300 RepID=UPI003AFB598C
MTVAKTSKSTRIDVRASIAVKQLLQEAAQSCHKNVSEFLLEAGINAANHALADRLHFGLDEKKWELFLQTLDRPVQKKPKLEKLLSEPGFLD